MTPADLPALYRDCPAEERAAMERVHPATMALVVGVESSGDPFAVNVNRLPPRAQPKPRTAAEAARAARFWIDAGFTVDMGLGQINDRNLTRLGYTVEQMFVPCTNLAAAALILAANYGAAVRLFGEGQEALGRALRRYNTGSFHRGDAYLARYTGTVPAARIEPRGAAATVRPPLRPAAANPYGASMTVRWWGGED